MAYTPKEWKDLPDETTPIQASDLNHIEQGIGDLNTSIGDLNTSIGDLNTLNTTNKSSIVGAINEVYQNNVYSSDEKIIGKWIDGKPIYRKIYQMNDVNSNSTGTQDISNLDIDNVWFDLNFCFCKSNNITLTLPRVNKDNISSQIELRVTSSTISIICGSSISAKEPIITIFYTKTTD